MLNLSSLFRRICFHWMVVVALLSCSKVQAQDAETLIELHRSKLQHLYGSRGMYGQEWPYTGEVSMEEVQSVLAQYPKKTEVLWYLHERDTLVVTLIGARKLQTAKFCITADSLSHAVRLLNHLYSRKFRSGIPAVRSAEMEDESGNEAEKLLLANQQKMQQLKDGMSKMLFPFPGFADSLNHVIIIPALNLATLPFACFKVDSAHDLIDKASYSIAPSLFELMAMDYVHRRNAEYGYWREPSEKQALLVGNPTYPKGKGWYFPDLPGALNEINIMEKKLAKMGYTGSVYRGDKATKRAVLKDICQFDLVYFATHGISNATESLDGSFIVLAGTDPDTSFLTAREIQDLRLKCNLKASLVVLSACQTGLGRTHDAGIIGLARAFQISGADHVLMSLWSVEDKATTKLMDMFMEVYLKSPVPNPSEALRQAILRFKAVEKDPYYWAAFCVFGVP